MAEQKCYQYINKLWIFVVCESFSIVFTFFFSFYLIWTGNVDTSTYFLPLRLAPPFSTGTLLGWYSFWLYQFLDIVAFLGATIGTALHFGGYCFYLHALCDHFDYLIQSTDDEFAQNQDSRPREESARERSLIARKNLSNAIEQHNTIYELVYRLFTLFCFPIEISIPCQLILIYRVFTMLADVSSGGIFAFLVLGSLWLGVSFYNLEHVSRCFFVALCNKNFNIFICRPVLMCRQQKALLRLYLV